MKALWIFTALFSPAALGLAALLSGGKSTETFTASYNAIGSASKRASSYYGQSCERSNDSYLCMMCNCMRESSGEPLEGKVMVGLVVKTRVQSKKWADDICGVIYEPWQFSWTMEDRGTRALPNTMTKDFNECMIATDRTINAAGNGVDHYHANYVRPKWAKNCDHAVTIARHIFYKNCETPSRSGTFKRGKYKGKARR